ncbi:YjfB family protein [Propionivibrio soli]|uniref:YjfB family protein n=1 Tax=Propionivibrio soli TaxID=2976531 RepID=UPI0021E7AEDD|nr:YjfB family protein [Propionivibrio soli]
MDINSVGNVSASLSSASTGNAVAIAVLKKSLDLQAQAALQLVQALPQAAPGTTATLGNNVNTFA